MNKCGNKELCCLQKEDSTGEDNKKSLSPIFGPAFDSAKKWYLIVVGSTFAHKRQCEICERRARILNVTQVILNAIVSSAIFTSLGDTTNEIDENKQYVLQIGAGSLSILIAILSAVSRTLDYEGRREAHFNAKRAFAKIKRRMEMLLFIKQTPLVIPKDKQEFNQWEGGPKMLYDMDPEWINIINAWEQVEMDSPDVSREQKIKYRKAEQEILDALDQLDPKAYSPIIVNTDVDATTGISEGTYNR